MAYWLNVMLLSNNVKMIFLWIVGIIPGLSDFYSQGCFRDSFSFLLYGADRNRHFSFYMSIKIFVNQSVTFCHFRINVIIVPIYLPNLEKSEGNLSMGKAFLLAFPVPLRLLPWAYLLFHLCFLRTPMLSSSILPLPSSPATFVQGDWWLLHLCPCLSVAVIM